jgi:hypothetical protein
VHLRAAGAPFNIFLCRRVAADFAFQVPMTLPTALELQLAARP